jgi:hypothetical protein
MSLKVLLKKHDNPLKLPTNVRCIEISSKYNELLDKHRQQLLESLPTNIPLKVTALLIEEENY